MSSFQASVCQVLKRKSLFYYESLYGVISGKGGVNEIFFSFHKLRDLAARDVGASGVPLLMIEAHSFIFKCPETNLFPSAAALDGKE